MNDDRPAAVGQARRQSLFRDHDRRVERAQQLVRTGRDGWRQALGGLVDKDDAGR